MFTRNLKAIEVAEVGDEGGYKNLVKSSLRTNSVVRNNHLDKLLENSEWKKSK